MIYKALILNDYPHAPYAEWVKTGIKSIETRMGRMFSYRGDLVICCGKKNSEGSLNAGKALCIVNLWKARPMVKEDEHAAMIHYDAQRICHLLKDWRHFSRDFEFAPQRVFGAFQSIFEIEMPADVEIIPKPDIIGFPQDHKKVTLFNDDI